MYPKEIIPPVRAWVEGSFTDIRHWAEQPKGGHFAAFEVPDLFVDDIRNVRPPVPLTVPAIGRPTSQRTVSPAVRDGAVT